MYNDHRRNKRFIATFYVFAFVSFFNVFFILKKR